MMASECLSDEEIERLLHRETPNVPRRVMEHVAGCPTCQHRLQETAGFPDLPTAPDGLDGNTLQISEHLSEVMQRLARWEWRASACDRNPKSGDLAPRWNTGDQFGGYQIVDFVGRGGFAEVYLATDPSLDRQVALKVPRVATLGSAQAYERFRREAQAAALLSHPRIVPVYETGKVEGESYIAFEYCPGVTLAHWFEERQRVVSARDAARMIVALADAVEHAHQRGVVHRDLKPSNVLVDSEMESRPIEKRLRITDFGLAIRLLADDQALTADGTALGTPMYMSPEQASGHATIGKPADVYSLGVMLYELLSGQVPIRKDTQLATLRAVETETPKMLRSLRSDLPADLEAICAKCLQKQPQDRYASAFDLAEDLRAWLAGLAISARSIPAWQQAARWAARNVGMTIALTMAFVSLIVGLSVSLWQRHVAQENFHLSQERLAEVDQQRDRALRHLDRLQASFDLIIQQYAATEFGKAEIASEDQRVLNHILQVQQKLLDEEYSGEASPLEPVKIYRRIAELQTILGNHSGALQTYTTILQRMNTIGKEHPEYGEAQSLRVHSLLAQAILNVADGDNEQAERRLASALDALLAGHDGWNEQDFQSLFRDITRHQQIVWTHLGKHDESRAAGELYLENVRRRLEQHPTSGVAQELWLQAQYDRALQALQRGELAAAQRQLRQLLEQCHQLQTMPPNLAVQNIRMLAHADLGDAYSQQREYASAIQEFEAALEIGNRLRLASPQKYMLTTKLAWIHAQFAKAARALSDVLLFQPHNQQALDLAHKAPPSRTKNTILAEQNLLAASLYTRFAQPDEAQRCLEGSLQASQTALVSIPQAPRFLELKRKAHRGLGNLYLRQKQSDDAEEQFILAFESSLALVGAHDGQARYVNAAINDLTKLLTLWSSNFKFEAAIRMLKQLGEAAPRNAEAQYQVAYGFARCALACQAIPDLAPETRDRQLQQATQLAIQHLTYACQDLEFTPQLDAAHRQTWDHLDAEAARVLLELTEATP